MAFLPMIEHLHLRSLRALVGLRLGPKLFRNRAVASLARILGHAVCCAQHQGMRFFFSPSL